MIPLLHSTLTLLLTSSVIEVRGVTIASVADWTEVDILKSKPPLQPSTQENLFAVALACQREESCKLICDTEEGYQTSSMEVAPEYYEPYEGEKYQCWTRMLCEFELRPTNLSQNIFKYRHQNN